MEIKIFEVTTERKTISILATKLSPEDEREQYLIRKAGFVYQYIIITKLDSMKTNFSPINWDDKIMQIIHEYIMINYDELINSQTISLDTIIRSKPLSLVECVLCETH